MLGLSGTHEQQGGGANVEARDGCPEEVAQEELVRTQSDALAGPRAVVVHSHYTPAANAAMVRPRRPDTLTLRADPELPEVSALLVHFHAQQGLK